MEYPIFCHPHPVLQDSADHLLHITVEDEVGVTQEQLWAKKMSEHEFRICCIPGLARNLALIDVVRTNAEYQIQEVVTRSGRWTLRAWSEDGWEHKEHILHRLAELGALMETCTPRLLAIDAPDDETALRIQVFLAEEEERGSLIYETGWE
jgi:hypothetical protein